jgi:hypothetical protein
MKNAKFLQWADASSVPSTAASQLSPTSGNWMTELLDSTSLKPLKLVGLAKFGETHAFLFRDSERRGDGTVSKS